MLSDLSPLVPELLVTSEDHTLLVFRPRLFVYVWIEVVVPALTTLLARSPL